MVSSYGSSYAMPEGGTACSTQSPFVRGTLNPPLYDVHANALWCRLLCTVLYCEHTLTVARRRFELDQAPVEVATAVDLHTAVDVLEWKFNISRASRRISVTWQ